MATAHRSSVLRGGWVLLLFALLAATGCGGPASWTGASCTGDGDCAQRTGAVVACVAGACSYACAELRADCDGNTDDGCEADLRAATSCGSCGVTCRAGAACDAAAPLPRCVCPAGLTDCGGACVDTATDLASCGACGSACAPAHAKATCDAGTCRITACAPGWSDCDQDPSNGCEADLSSNETCGTCELRCGDLHGGNFRRCDATAVPPACVTTCPPTATPCGDACVDVASDPRHCGGCAACALPHAFAACESGVCRIAECLPGWGDCDADASDGCEQRLDADAHCGTCGAACGPMEACTASGGPPHCASVCPAGTTTCGLGCVDTATDLANCGACGQACAVPNGSPACRAGTCAVGSCNPGRADCDSSASNGCETALHTIENCAACFDACVYPNGVGACELGACRLAACAPGFDDCNGLAVDGCERDLLTDAQHCGSCAMSCSAVGGTPACVAGSCQITCDPWRADCDGDVSNGCEQSLVTLAHCGACYRTCAFPYATATCATGTCAMVSCDAGRADCDASPANGCEVDVLSDVASCGGCGTHCSFANASAVCSGGVCAVGACNPGWYDRDGDPANGCESRCDSSDLPDDAFEDSNCDGIDGDASHAIFVSPLGADYNPGTRAAPKRTIQAAVDLVRSLGPESYDVYAAGGTYSVSSTLNVYAGVSIYGGYDPHTWARSDSSPAVISRTGIADASGRVTALSCANVDIHTVLDRVSLVTDDAITASADNVAVSVSACRGLYLNRVTMQAGRGGAGTPGTNGSAGRAGENGGAGGNGSCDANWVSQINGQGGDGCHGLYDRGGLGGSGGGSENDWDGYDGMRGCGPGDCTGSGGGAGGSGGNGGDPGKAGGNGGAGASGTSGSRGGGGAPGAVGGDGTAGTNGSGGGGGGGGGGQTCFTCDNGMGNAGGGGGGGACGGTAGHGGGAGGDSIALEIASGTLGGQVKGCTIAAAGAGSGGAGGTGGSGGQGGSAGAGATHCTSEIGAGGDGGRGGNGGSGGHGGGGGGGSCWGIVGPSSDQAALLGDNTVSAGPAGAGGTSPGSPGQAGSNGAFHLR